MSTVLPRNMCNHVCPNHERTRSVYCSKLQHSDDDSPHICGSGHVWAAPILVDDPEHASQNQLRARIDVLEAEVKHLSDDQIKPLADYLLSIGGPDRDECACEMAVRLLKQYQDEALSVRELGLDL